MNAPFFFNFGAFAHILVLLIIPCSMLQGLLRRLGAGLDDPYMSMGGAGPSRIKSIIALLREDDEGQQLTGLTELCEYLAVATEETMISFPIDQIVPLLVRFLNMEHNPDVMLLAARALTNLADVFPPSCSYIIRHGAVDAFCARLLSIEYIDLAEQSLQALEKLSHEHPGSLLRAGALVAVLSYVDFFQTGVQRVAVATAANICRGLSLEYVDAVSTATPILINLLRYPDAKIVDSACLALTRIAEAFSRSPERMELLVSFGLISSIVDMVAVNETGGITSQLSSSTFYGLVKLLATCASGSHVVAENLLQAGISNTLRNLLVSSPLLSATTASPGNALRSSDQLQDLVSLASQLLPAIPDATVAVLTPPRPAPAALSSQEHDDGDDEDEEGDDEDEDEEEEKELVVGRSISTATATATAAATATATRASVQATALAGYLKENPEVADTVATDLVAVMLRVHASSGTAVIKRKCRNVLAKLLYHTSSSTLSALLYDLPISSLIARLLQHEDATVTAEGMQMAEILMEKLPEEYSKFFMKEGVVHAMEELAAAAPSSSKQNKTAATMATTTTPQGLASALPARSPSAHTAADTDPSSSGGGGSGGVRTRSRALSDESAQQQQTQQQQGPQQQLGSFTPAGTTLRNALATHAARFCVRYFTDKSGKSFGRSTQGVLTLQEICSRLPDPKAVSDLLTALSATGESGISTFEVLMSGTMHALRLYLQGEDIMGSGGGGGKRGKEKMEGEGSEEEKEEVEEQEARHWALLQRLGEFADIAMPPGSGGTPPLVHLVEKIQTTLNATEKFEVQLADVPSIPSFTFFPGAGGGGGGFMGGGRSSLSRSGDGASGSISAGLAALSNPFKIRLTRHVAESKLKDYSSNVVLIEPLASMNQVEEFLWQRVHMSPMEQQRQQQGGGGGDGAGPSTAAAGTGGTSSRPNTRSRGPPEASRSRPIPSASAATAEQQLSDSATRRRMTRAQARAAAEAEVAAQGVQRDGQEVEVEVEVEVKAEEGPSSSQRATQQQRQQQKEEEGKEYEDDHVMEGIHHGGGMDFGEDDDDEEHDDDDNDDIIDDDDDDMEDGYVEGEDGFDDEDDMMDAAAMHVHDMHLNDAEGVGGGTTAAATATASSQHRRRDQPPPPPPSQNQPSQQQQEQQQHQQQRGGTAHTHRTSNATSYAHAASQAPAQPRLAFYHNGRLLDPGVTIFQVIRAHTSSSISTTAPGRSLGSRLWGDVHSLTYRSYDDAIAASQDAPEGTSARKNGGGGKEEGQDAMDVDGTPTPTPTRGMHWSSALLSSPLAPLLDPPLVFTDTRDSASLANTASPDCLNALIVLSLLEALNRLALHLKAALQSHHGTPLPPSALHPGHASREVFVNGRLGTKLSQQLKDVLSICGGALPPWCHALSQSARFLFPFDVRRRLFYCTAFGLARALLYLQQSHVAENGPGNAGDRDAGSLRLSRVQRQKVRISRNRILESAHRVFEQYAGAKSQLEVEFFGEAGSGLGPTLEFYTLLSHDLQRVPLGLWRDEGVVDEVEKTSNTTTNQMSVDMMMKFPPAPQSPSAHQTIHRTVSGPGPLRGELMAVDTGTGTGGGNVVNTSLDDGTAPTDLVNAPYGLFPKPLPPLSNDHGTLEQKKSSSTEFVARHFRLLGRVVAKALQDCRLLDLPLSPVFYRLVLGRKVDLFSIRAIDPALATSLERLHAAACAAHSNQSSTVMVDGCMIEDLCLTFVLPGDQEYELCPGGADMAVTSENVRQYIDAVVDATLGSGVATQVEAFRSGFNAIFSLPSLAPFYEDEIEAMLCGTGEAWTAQGLGAVIKFDHGYTATSAPVVALLEVLAELDAVDQRRFLRFVTGTPRLPPGGVASLQPRLTVVRKLSTTTSTGTGVVAGGGGGTSVPTGSMPTGSMPSSEVGSFMAGGGGGRNNPADGDLPSVMTCANYLKLPPYSSKEVLRERLLFAIREGQGSFDLS